MRVIDPDLKGMAVGQLCHGVMCGALAMWLVEFEPHGCVRDGHAVPTCMECADFLREDHDDCVDCMIRGRSVALTIKEATPIE